MKICLQLMLPWRPTSTAISAFCGSIARAYRVWSCRCLQIKQAFHSEILLSLLLQWRVTRTAVQNTGPNPRNLPLNSIRQQYQINSRAEQWCWWTSEKEKAPVSRRCFHLTRGTVSRWLYQILSAYYCYYHISTEKFFVRLRSKLISQDCQCVFICCELVINKVITIIS